jgi:hypothetical protein
MAWPAADAARVHAQRTHGAARSERVPWHSSRWLASGQPLTRCTPQASQPMVQSPDTVESPSSKRGRWATERQNSPVQSTAPEVNSGEGITFLVREAAPKLKEDPGSTYGERGGVRWLDTDGAVENRGGCGGGGLRRRTRRGCGRDAEVASFYSRVLCRSNVGLHKDGEREVTTQRSSRAGVLMSAARHNSDVAVAAA